MSKTTKTVVKQAVDWTAVSAKLKPETVASINAFRRRHTELQKLVTDLRDQNKQPINFDVYKLKNKRVVEEAQRAWSGFKPAAYDLTTQLRVIGDHEGRAISSAQQTTQKMSVELEELKEMLDNIEQSRPIDQLTVDDVVKAAPEIEPTVEKMAKRSQWRVPGYYEKFGEFLVGF